MIIFYSKKLQACLPRLPWDPFSWGFSFLLNLIRKSYIVCLGLSLRVSKESMAPPFLCSLSRQRWTAVHLPTSLRSPVLFKPPQSLLTCHILQPWMILPPSSGLVHICQCLSPTGKPRAGTAWYSTQLVPKTPYLFLNVGYFYTVPEQYQETFSEL